MGLGGAALDAQTRGVTYRIAPEPQPKIKPSEPCRQKTACLLPDSCLDRLIFNVSSGDLHDIRHAKPPQLANLPCARILVREPSADELVVFSSRRVGKNRNARRDAVLHEVCRFERPRAAGIKRYDDDVAGRDRFVDHERPSCGSQNRLPNGGNSNDGGRGQCDHQ
jgi:hypothetical protein